MDLQTVNASGASLREARDLEQIDVLTEMRKNYIKRLAQGIMPQYQPQQSSALPFDVRQVLDQQAKRIQAAQFRLPQGYYDKLAYSRSIQPQTRGDYKQIFY